MKLQHATTLAGARFGRHAWTLIEMMVAVTAGMLILASVASVYVFTNRTMDATANYEELDRQSRNALDTMTRDIRQSSAITNQSANTIWLLSQPDTNGNTFPMMYNWSSNRARL